ncbi:imidazolonepropionase [Palleniella muris]|uniref:Imidazolonepropionase n=1 Tax=Palleniella muris TaxID=3038145 RepID=A0AC61QP45_9BACT|nr:imidazolonepropionase [Palleniella muris]TGX80961.1 imidazolonepropionase [Palleniella muris]
MMLFTNIGALVGIDESTMERKQGAEMNSLGILHNAWLLVDGERIVDYGAMSSLEKSTETDDRQTTDVGGGWIFPSFCDSHTHIVYAGNRATEWLDKINGLSYEEIGKRGGGILNSADLLHNTTEEELYSQAMTRVDEMICKGTGAIEIKSGYGLNTEDELKMLRVIQRIKQTTKAEIKSTFLGAHAVGRKYADRQSEYVDLVCNEMIPEVGRKQLADYVDVFCDKGYFTPEETEKILEAAEKYGLVPKIHANELAVSGGVQVGVKHNALSVDHLENTTSVEFNALKGTRTMPTLLPGCSFFSNLPYANAKTMIAMGLGVALASDYNPGSSPFGDMRFVASLACIRMRLTPEQALNATTINGAYAMGLNSTVGTITRGKIANFYITAPLPSLEFYLYAHHTPLIREVYLKGEKYEG